MEGRNAPPSQCDGHHIIHWADGGLTTTTNRALFRHGDHDKTPRRPLDRQPRRQHHAHLHQPNRPRPRQLATLSREPPCRGRIAISLAGIICSHTILQLLLDDRILAVLGVQPLAVRNAPNERSSDVCSARPRPSTSPRSHTEARRSDPVRAAPENGNTWPAVTQTSVISKGVKCILFARNLEASNLTPKHPRNCPETAPIRQSGGSLRLLSGRVASFGRTACSAVAPCRLDVSTSVCNEEQSCP